MLKNKSFIWISLIVLIFGILVVPEIINRFKNNQVTQGSRLDSVENNGKIDSDLVTIGKAPSYEFPNQDNKKISDKDYLGKVYVLEFFFSTCPTICPKMNKSMLEIEKTYFGNPNFGIVSITINPEVDTPAVLKQHAKDLGVKSSNWNFLSGDKTKIFELANKGFNLYAGENSKINGGFEHSGFFALIDKKGNIRSRKDDYGNPMIYYDGIDVKGVEAIQQDIAKLLRE